MTWSSEKCWGERGGEQSNFERVCACVYYVDYIFSDIRAALRKARLDSLIENSELNLYNAEQRDCVNRPNFIPQSAAVFPHKSS